LNNNYLYYYLKSTLGQYQIRNLTVGAVQPKLPIINILSIQLSLPPLPTQRKIAAVLGALDDKIENNRKICANLEAQAQAIFKSWFVDFEPFGGKMPQGWKMGKLGDVADITMGQSPDGKSLNDVGDGITFFQGRAEFGNRFPTKRLSTTEPNRMAKTGDVLLSVRAPVGDLNIALEDCCIGRGLAAIRSKAGSQSFIYCLLKALKPAFDLYEGAGTIFGSINKDSLHGLDVVVPDSGWIEKFESVVSSHDRMYRERELESRALAAMRDALLPKLMSGEIDVEKVKVA
jgi:type I restriction enzyme S subunit